VASNNPVGYGIAFPLTVSNGSIASSTNVDQSQVSITEITTTLTGYIEQLFTTRIGELEYAPEFGNPAWDYLFLPNDSETIAALQFGLTKVINDNLPGIRILSIIPILRGNSERLEFKLRLDVNGVPDPIDIVLPVNAPIEDSRNG